MRNKNKWNIFFLLLISSPVTIGLNFLFPIITAILSSKTTNTLHSFPLIFSLAFLYRFWMSLECSIKVLRSLQCFKPTFSFSFLIKSSCFASNGALAYRCILSISCCYFIKLSNPFDFSDIENQVINIMYFALCCNLFPRAKILQINMLYI